MQQKHSEILTKRIFLQELKKLATKDELKKLATKDELKKLSQRTDSFEKSIRNEFSAHKIAIELKLDEHEDKAEASRQKFYSKIYDLVDTIAAELKTSREERGILSGRTYENVSRLDNHETRIKVLEQATAL